MLLRRLSFHGLRKYFLVLSVSLLFSSATSFVPRTFRGAPPSSYLSMSTSSPSPDKKSPPPNTVLIAGAGVIGTSTAYYLATSHSIKSILVDPTGQIAPAASGKAGGFLALDWNDMSPIRSLARRSFALHEELAEDENLGSENIMYRRLTCAAISVDPMLRKRPGGKKLDGVEWVEDEKGTDYEEGSSVMGVRRLGDEGTIAQVHPKMLCDAMWKVASRPTEDGGVGSELVKGEVASAVFEDDNKAVGDRKLVGARLSDGTVIEADAILYACGPWTSHGGDDIMAGVKYHSAVIPTPRVLTQSVFFDGCGDPEVYPRPDSTAYCTGFPDPAVRVTERPGNVEVRPEAIARILDSVTEASGEGGALGAKPTLEQACYLPVTPDGLPMMGTLDGSGGRCYMAAGHGCWGILMGPGTGETMASLIATGKSTEYVDMRPFRPSRFAGVGIV